ncbi:MAG: peptide-methionine (S)-S-oxide reductase MsrA [Rhodospirillales bacterium]|nr:peptide-methionine (S)-S-oxide reductase MsrA [Rhodospirillales bacterium]MCB9996709.1 peptide-methionine (S)-S-oxide reductase MsrA [Rhodospirillales bacterium]
MRLPLIVITLCLLAIGGFISLNTPGHAGDRDTGAMLTAPPEGYPVATLAGGCFWCLESEFRGREGVLYTVVGYSGGTAENPTYKQVTTGKTGHAEAVQIFFDPKKTSFHALLEHFLTAAHDPTQVDGQWVDKGTQYRSVIFYHDAAQKQEAEQMIAALDKAKRFKKPIATRVEPFETFWPAEEYHQQYYEKYKARTGQDHIRVYLKEQKKKHGN